MTEVTAVTRQYWQYFKVAEEETMGGDTRLTGVCCHKNALIKFIFGRKALVDL